MLFYQNFKSTHKLNQSIYYASTSSFAKSSLSSILFSSPKKSVYLYSSPEENSNSNSNSNSFNTSSLTVHNSQSSHIQSNTASSPCSTSDNNCTKPVSFSSSFFTRFINDYFISKLKFDLPSPPDPLTILNSNSTTATTTTTANLNSNLNVSNLQLDLNLNNKTILEQKKIQDYLKFKKIIQNNKMESEYLTNIINYKPKFYNDSKISIWHKLPVYRRSAVLILLFLGKSGELRVVLTKRSKKLRSFSGHISLPGGKSDSGLESEWQVARREAEEEIGINRHNDFLKENFDFEIEKINLLPSYLSRTFLAVSPVIGFINWSSKRLSKIEEQHISNIILNPGESSSIFSVPLKDFLQPKPKKYELKECLKQSYTKTNWAGITWKLRSFIFPLHNDQEVKWLDDVQDLSSEDEETQTDMEFGEKTRNVWGLTANILHDLAEITYRGESHYSNSIYGEEDLMYSLINKGNQMKTKIRSDFEKSIINNSKGFKFQDVLGSDEINNLNKIYNRI